MNPADLFGSGQVSDGSGDTEDAVESARAEPHCSGSIGEQLAAGFVRSRHFVEQFAVRFGIGSDA